MNSADDQAFDDIDVEADDTLSVEWVIKASKLCNLRCRYCYEWDSLADPARLSLDEWQSIFVAVREFAALKSAANGGADVRTSFVWHGGEPLLLGVDYICDVVSLQRDVLGAAAPVRNAMQTNFYRVEPEVMACLEEYGFSLGVSLDFSPGARLTAAGQETEARVLENLETYRDHPCLDGFIVVLAGHTVHDLPRAYDFARQHGKFLRVLPLFDGPDGRPMVGLDIGESTVVDALFDLFERWLGDGCPIPIEPLEGLLKTAMLHEVSLAQPRYDRRAHLDSVFLVDIDGSLYQPGDIYGAERALGNIFNQPIGDIVRGDAYRQSIGRNESRAEGVCSTCAFDGACDRYPVLAERRRPDGIDDCAVARPMLERMSDVLKREGVGADTLAAWL